MSRYCVHLELVSHYDAEVEAESEEEARNIAEDRFYEGIYPKEEFGNCEVEAVDAEPCE